MTKPLRVFVAFIGFVALGDTPTVFAQCELGQLFGSDTALGDHFGEAVAIDGDFLVIGAHADDDMGSFSGSAYVFARQGLEWIEHAKLVADDGALFDAFGLAVTISGDYVAVGALADDDDGGGSGAVYVFARNGETWVQQAKLTALDASAGDAFGVSVAMDGDLLVVGAHRVDDAGEDSGAAYVFRRVGSTWSQEAKLTPDDADESDFFGEAVAISGDTVIVGAARDDAAKNAGAAYVFVREDLQ